MKDRTSFSYRAPMPGERPDMHKNGGMSRDEFKRVRCSPYVREHSQDRSGESAQRQGERASQDFSPRL